MIIVKYLFQILYNIIKDRVDESNSARVLIGCKPIIMNILFIVYEHHRFGSPGNRIPDVKTAFNDSKLGGAVTMNYVRQS